MQKNFSNFMIRLTERNYSESEIIIKNFTKTASSLSAQIAMNDKYTALHLETFSPLSSNSWNKFLLLAVSCNLFSSTKIFIKILTICNFWTHILKPKLIKSLAKTSEFVTLYTDYFPQIELLTKEKNNNILGHIHMLIKKLRFLKYEILETEHYLIRFINLATTLEEELQGRCIPRLAKIIAKENALIDLLANKSVDIQTNIDYLEKKIMDIEISMGALCITLAISTISGSIFTIIAEIIAIAGLAITDTEFHEKLEQFKRERFSVTNQLKNTNIYLTYFINLKKELQIITKEYKQTTNFFSSFKNFIYDMESIFDILLDKFNTIYIRIKETRYRFLHAALCTINKEFMALKKKLESNQILHNLPIRQTRNQNQINYLNFSSNSSLIIPNKLYFEYKKFNLI